MASQALERIFGLREGRTPYTYIPTDLLLEIAAYRGLDTIHDRDLLIASLGLHDTIDNSFASTATSITPERVTDTFPQLPLLYYLAGFREIELSTLQPFPENARDFLLVRIFGPQEIVPAPPQTRRTQAPWRRIQPFLSRLDPEGKRKIIRNLYDDPVVDLLDEATMDFILLHGYFPPDFSLPPALVARYQQLLSLSPETVEILRTLYRCPVGSSLGCIVGREISPLETFVIALEDFPAAEVAHSLGMVDPPGVDTRSYVENNIRDYLPVVTRPENLPPLTLEDFQRGVNQPLTLYVDDEIFGGLQAYIGYNSRASLIANYTRARDTPMFFVPIERNCRNAQTFLFSPTDDPALDIVAYGTLDNYQCYEQDELLSSFTEYSEGNGRGLFSFRRPDQRSVFTRDEIQQLLTTIQPYNSFRPLVVRIQRGLRETTIQTQAERRVVEEFNQLEDSDKETIRSIFHNLFRAGMFMRRWTGTGCFPLRETQTLSQVDPEILTNPALIEINRLYQSLSPTAKRWLEQLPRQDLVGDRITPSATRVYETYVEVYQGRRCIRMASSPLVVSSYYYLRLLFGETIPNFNPLAVESIQ